MKPPSTFSCLIGNPVITLVLMVGALCIIGLWLTGYVTGWLALFAAITGLTAAKASERVNAYSAWKREWDGIRGGGLGLRVPSRKTIRTTTAVAVWGVFAIWASEGAHGDPMMEVAIVMFWIATAIMAMMGVHRLLRGTTPKRRADVVVSVCLSPSIASNNVRSAMLALPAHCQRLLESTD